MKLFNVDFKSFLSRNVATLLLLIVGGMTFVSCSDNSYVNAIPASVTAIVKVNPSEIGKDEVATFMQAALPLGDVSESGIDMGSPFFAFETVDGNFGLCAKVSDFDNVANALSSLASKGKCGKLTKFRGGAITEINKSWAIGFSDKAFVVLGPFAEASMAEAQHGIMRMLRQDEDQSVVVRPMFAKLDSIAGAVSMVAQLQALPEKFAAPFSVGVPENADNTQVLVSASFSLSKGILRIEGETFSFSKSIDKEIKKSLAVYRKIGGTYVGRMPDTCPFGFLANVDGKAFLPLLQRSQSFKAILTGMNAALDFDNILRSVDGDIVIMGGIDGVSTPMNLNVLAKIKNPTWTADVEYWKQSCPSGTSIVGTANDWLFRSGDTNFKFGVNGNEFYCVTDDALAKMGGDTGDGRVVNDELSKVVVGKRMAMVLNVKPMLAKSTMPQGVAKLLKPLTDHVNMVVYVVD